MDSLFWWIGCLVFCAAAGIGVVAVLAGIYGLLALAFAVYSSKVFNGIVNFNAVHQWDKNGRPKWEFDKASNTFVMRPSKGAVEVEEATP